MVDHARMLSFIETCSDSNKLQSLIKNADKMGATVVGEAARRRLFAVLARQEPGTLAFDVWESIHALEHALKDERGKTTLLSRTRQKIARVGEERTVIDLVETGTASSGFDMLIERGWPELTFEALALKHLNDPDIRAHASDRLRNAGVDVTALEVKLRR